MTNAHRPTRRTFLEQSALGAAALAAAAAPTASCGAAPQAAAPPPRRVSFASGDGTVVGNLYLPPGLRDGAPRGAVVVGGSLTSVKEQMGGTYAAAMAERGFIALAVDYRHYGESSGEPRQYEDPEAKAEDLSAAVTFLASRRDVRPDAVGLLGVCTSGGNVLYAAARDGRVGAVASVAGHFAEPSITPSFYGAEAVERRRAEGRAARAEYERTGESETILAYHDTDLSASHVGPMQYYLDPSRGGGIPQWQNAFAVMSWGPWLDFDPVREAARVTAPALVVHSDGCVLPGQARKVYDLLKGPKALHWAGGDHFDFYDGPEKIREAADAAAEHFRKHMP